MHRGSIARCASIVLFAVACLARAASSAATEKSLPPPTQDPKLIASLARLTTTRDSIRYLLDGFFFDYADSLASRRLAQAELLHDAESRDLMEPLLAVAEARAPRGRLLRPPGSGLVDRIRRLERQHPFSPPEEARFEVLLGNSLHIADRYDSAAAHFDRALTILASTAGPESPEYARVLVRRALTLRGHGRPAEATPMLAQACRIDERELGAESPEYLDAFEYLVSSPQYAENTLIETYDRIFAGFRQCFGDRAPRLWLTAYHAYGAYLTMGRKREGRDLILEALAITQANHYKDVDDLLYGEVAGAEMELQNYARAESIYTVWIGKLRASKTPDESISLFFPRQNRAVAYDHLGRFEEAERELEALEPVILREWGEGSGQMMENTYVRGRIALARGDTALARSKLELSQVAARLARPRMNPDAPDEAGFVESQLALCHWLSGRRREAFELALRVESDSRNRLRRVTRSLSDDDALGLERIRESGLGLALTALFSEGAQAGDSARVFDAVVRSRALVLDAVTARHVRARRSSNGTAQILADSLESLGREVASAAIRDPTSADDRLELEREFRARRRSLTARLAALDPARASDYGGDTVGADDVASALPSHSTLVSFVRFDRCDSQAGSAVDRRRTTPWYAAFVVASDALGVRGVDLGPASEIDSMIERWRALVVSAGTRSPADNTSATLGDSLRRRLWDPLVGESNESARLFVVPDGLVSFLPFAALPGRDGRFVLEESGPISYLSAERDLASTLPRATGRGWIVLGDPDYSRAEMATAAVVGEPHAVGGTTAELQATHANVYRGRTSHCEDFRGLAFSRLIQSGAEARDIAELSRRNGVPVALLTGAEASEQSFKRYAPGRSHIHVASHGFFFSSRCSREVSDIESPLIRSGIALAGANERASVPSRANAPDLEDGILTAEEVATLNLTAAQCVFLSSCESGVGDVSTGEGVMGLRRAFHEAGAGALVSTLWEVEDSATRLWVREFYRAYLNSASDPALAARQASLAMVRRQRSATGGATPATWGAFLVSGR